MDQPAEKRKYRIMVWYVTGAIVGVLLLQYFLSNYSHVDTIPYSQFEQLLNEGKISEVSISTDSIQGELKEPLPDGKRQFYAVRVDPQLAEKLATHDVIVKGVSSGGIMGTILSWVIPLVIFYFMWMFLFRGIADRQGIGGLMAVGKSHAKVC